MHKNLNSPAMGLSGRQSEIVELALSHGYDSISLDMEDLQVKVEKKGIEHAARYLASAGVKAGPFRLPVNWQGDEATFQTDLARLDSIAATASELGAKSCWTTVMAASDELPYHENFEFHRTRFTAIADVLAKHDMWLGIAFLATAPHREGKQHQFIATPDALITLMKTVGVKNVGVVLDLWNWRVAGGTIDQIREMSPEQIVNVHLADVPADMPLESLADRDRTMPTAESEFLVEAMKALLEMGYEGPITPMPSSSRMPRQTRDARAISAANAIDKLLRVASGEEVPAEAPPEEEATDETAESAESAASENGSVESPVAEETVEAS